MDGSLESGKKVWLRAHDTSMGYNEDGYASAYSPLATGGGTPRQSEGGYASGVYDPPSPSFFERIFSFGRGTPGSTPRQTRTPVKATSETGEFVVVD